MTESSNIIPLAVALKLLCTQDKQYLITMWKHSDTYWSLMRSILADIRFAKSVLCCGQKVSCSFMMGGANSCHTCTLHNSNSRSNDNSTCWKSGPCYLLYVLHICGPSLLIESTDSMIFYRHMGWPGNDCMHEEVIYSVGKEELLEKIMHIVITVDPRLSGTSIIQTQIGHVKIFHSHKIK